MSSNCRICFIVSIVLVCGCASQVLQYDKAEEVLKTEEYDQKVRVKPADAAALKVVSEPTPDPAPPEKRHRKKSKKSRKKEEPAVKTPKTHEPTMEDSEGFIGRRPIDDPYRPGEKVTLNLSYFNIVAGTMEIAVKPMVEVNGQKAYHFEVTAQSNSFFNRIYGVNDTAVTYMLYDEMIPLNLQITIKETKQLAEARTFFDWKGNKASYWQKRVSKDHGEESKKVEWDIEPFSQNVISAAYYLRVFKYEVGKKFAFRVADEGKNIVFSAEVLRREKLKTEIGELDTVVIKPVISVDGAFKPMGDILFWLTDDARKFIVRIESKIKIGTIVAKLKSLEKGQE